MSYTFLQYDKRWGSRLYPKGNKRHSTFATSGCGPSSSAGIIYNIDENITPLVVGNYLSSIDGATQGGDTKRAKMSKVYDHFGMVGTEYAKMSDFLKELLKGDCWGNMLFRGGTKGGITWTKGGHYMQATAIKVKNGKHYLYMRDSGLRKHTGWYCYETQMKGLVDWCMIVRRKETKKFTKPKQNTKETEKFVEPKKTPNEKAIDGAISFAKKIAKDNTYKYKKWTDDVKTHQCPICHNLKGKYKGWNCIGFVSACFYHGAGAKIKCSCEGLGNNAFFDHVTLDKWKKRNGEYWTMPSRVSKGCVVLCYKNGKYKHTALHIGDGKIADATSSRGITVRQYSELKGYSKKFFKYTGKGKF